ncbi:MAG: ferrous iron transport protein B [Ignavibacteriae bacterium]|nr:MAG: ferrous iron transport protein B [Ignavibacteriota bacterium]
MNKVLTKSQLVTLVGPPNSGKTTLFNQLSGKNVKTVNYPGSTIEYNSTQFQNKFNIEAILLDSPGIISLVPNSPDEQVTVDSLFEHPVHGTPKLIIATVDASQLSRHLLLVKQLLNANFNVIIAVTMIDILAKKNLRILKNELAELMECNVVFINGRTGEGIESLVSLIKSELSKESHKNLSQLETSADPKLILEQFKEIEKIEKKVVVPIADEKDLVNANNKLNVVDNNKINKPDSFSIKLDKILLHKVWGILFFLIITGIMFTSIFWLALPLMEFVDEGFANLAVMASNSLGDNWFSDLISDGIISSLGAVMVFVPQIIILFLILGFLEDTGYLARGAMLIDRPLSKIGLNGRSFVPMLSGFACAIPAMMAARTISNKKERLLTIFIVPLMSCSARLPVYALLIAFLIPKDNPLLGGFLFASIYFFSIVSSVIIAAIINKFSGKIFNAEQSSSFILELPSYKIPTVQSVYRNTYANTKQYIKQAGPVIIVFSILLWALTYFPNYSPDISQGNLTDEQYEEVILQERVSNSYAAQLGKFIEPMMRPLGMDWRIGVSFISAFVAREVFVSSLALMFKITGDEDTIQKSILDAMRKAKINGTDQKLFTLSTAIGIIVFFVFAMQCLTTVAVAKKETGNWKIPILQIVFFTGVAYVATFIAVNGLRLLGFE